MVHVALALPHSVIRIPAANFANYWEVFMLRAFIAVAAVRFAALSATLPVASES